MDEEIDPYRKILMQLSIAEKDIFKVNRKLEEQKQEVRNQIDELLAIVEKIPTT